MSSSGHEEFVKVVENRTSEFVELPVEDDGTLLLTTLQGQFPNAAGLRYRSSLGSSRGVRISGEALKPPQEGWGCDIEYEITTKDSASNSNLRIKSNIVREIQQQINQQLVLFSELIEDEESMDIGHIISVTQEKIINYFKDLANKLMAIKGVYISMNVDKIKQEKVQDGGIRAGHVNPANENNMQQPQQHGNNIGTIANCTFFKKGFCRWGLTCRWRHPGINDDICLKRLAEAAPQEIPAKKVPRYESNLTVITPQVKAIKSAETAYKGIPANKICRFFTMGHCKSGIACPFLHPGVNDKGKMADVAKEKEDSFQKYGDTKDVKEPRDLIVLNVPAKCTADDLKLNLGNSCGALEYCKVSPGTLSGFGYVKFKTLEGEKTAITGVHMVMGSKLTIKVKHLKEVLFVNGLGDDVTVQDVKDYFTQFAEVANVFIPRLPRRNFAFVTLLFASHDDFNITLSKDHKMKIRGKHKIGEVKWNVKRVGLREELLRRNEMMKEGNTYQEYDSNISANIESRVGVDDRDERMIRNMADIGGARKDNMSDTAGSRMDNMSNLGGSRKDDTSDMEVSRRDNMSDERGSRRDSMSDMGGSRRDNTSDRGGSRRDMSDERGSRRDMSDERGSRRDSDKGSSRRDNTSDRGGSRRDNMSDRGRSRRDRSDERGSRRDSDKGGSRRDNMSDRGSSRRDNMSDREGSRRDNMSDKGGSRRENMSDMDESRDNRRYSDNISSSGSQNTRDTQDDLINISHYGDISRYSDSIDNTIQYNINRSGSYGNDTANDTASLNTRDIQDANNTASLNTRDTQDDSNTASLNTRDTQDDNNTASLNTRDEFNVLDEYNGGVIKEEEEDNGSYCNDSALTRYVPDDSALTRYVPHLTSSPHVPSSPYVPVPRGLVPHVTVPHVHVPHVPVPCVPVLHAPVPDAIIKEEEEEDSGDTDYKDGRRYWGDNITSVSYGSKTRNSAFGINKCSGQAK